MTRQHEDYPDTTLDNSRKDATENSEELNQDPGERQKENQGDQKSDPLAA